ncbi:hypothetical protein [Sphingobacterium kitahiroshimense]|uniref:O-antigen ligase domain-containing protein n=1 Tax=Sphingobacterium kitahiroshimense TaxID=470446 RepID=A0ABV0BVY6_9SPHI
MIRILQIIFTVLLVSTYFFSFGFTFLPTAINTKVILAAIGSALLFMEMLKNRKVEISVQLLVASGIAIVFSLICYFATDVNGTADFAYATYVMSFILWLLAGYTVIYTLKQLHGVVNVRLLTYYLAAASLMQCILALCIDSYPAVQILVDRYVEQGQEFVQEVKRLYGVGASLDNAGVRFSIVLILLSSQFRSELFEKKKLPLLITLLLTFFAILTLGSIISRTTSVGGAIGLAYMMFGTGMLRRTIHMDFMRFLGVLFLMLSLAGLVAMYFYETNAMFKDYMRFAFEGFFNYFEKGEWRTDSTDKLTKNMWVWPSDTKTWLIGTGLFDGWVFDTDIGYCRFILYCGLTGFIVFAIFFIFNALNFAARYSKYKWLFVMLLALSFVAWFKVSTDIFLIYALFYCIESLQGSLFTFKINTKNENRLLHLGNI